MIAARSRFSLLYATLFFELGVNLPFFPLWLRAQALDPREIGFVLASPFLVRIVANPIVAAYADRSGRMSATLVACAAAVPLGTAFLFFANGFWTILLTVTVVALAQGPLIAVSDTLTLQALKQEPAAELHYGRMRLWGSASFALANVAAGWTVAWLNASSIVALLCGSALAVLFAAVAVARVSAAGPEAPSPAPMAVIESPRLIGLVIVGAGLVQASHAAVYAFSTLHWEEQGLASGTIGGLWASGVISEIAVFGLAGHVAFGLRGAIILVAGGAAAATARWIGMAADPAIAIIAALQVLHGLSFGATHLGSVFLLTRLAPRSMYAQVQAWLAAAWAGSMAALTALSGSLYAAWGQHVYWLMAATSGIGLLSLAVVAAALAEAHGRAIALDENAPAP